MKIDKAVLLMNKYGKCPNCNNKTLGNGQGNLIIADKEFVRDCKCGYTIKTDEDGNIVYNEHRR